MQNKPFTIIISRTDSIGDVVLTLPMAGLIKKHMPGAKLVFIGRSYTRDVVALSRHIDQFINYDTIEKLLTPEKINAMKSINADAIIHVFPNKAIATLAKTCGIPNRIGTTNRIFHWWTCNRLVRLSRKNSDLHESQLNMKLLTYFKMNQQVELNDIPGFYGFTNLPQLSNEFRALIDSRKYNIILHPKSKGSAKEWGLDNFEKLIDQLPAEKYNVFICGTDQDGKQMQNLLQKNHKAVNLVGQLSLSQYIAFINNCDALVAASTGPLHIAAALGKNAIGLFSPKRPIHPGRWMPIGINAHFLVFEKDCQKCAAGEDCNCIQQITPQQIVDLLAK